MKVGNIFYFVDTVLGKIIKQKIVDIVPPHSGGNFLEGKSESITFFDKIKTSHSWLHINPTPEEYPFNHSQFYRSTKSFLVFTDVKDAQKCLIDYVFPQMLEVKQMEADGLMRKFNKIIEKSQNIEVALKSNIDNFGKKCNALEKKFV